MNYGTSFVNKVDIYDQR